MVRRVGSWTLFTSNRVDTLVEALLGRMHAEPLPPLEKEIVLVQSRGLSRYLEIEIASREGIAGSLDMPFVGSYLQRLCGRSERDDAWSIAALTLRIFRLLGDPARSESLGAAHDYVRDDPTQKKRLALAEALAQRFDDYQLYRPDFLRQFARGESPRLPHADWQQRLWRMLLDERGEDAAAAHRVDALRARIESDDALDLPTRLSVFGVSTMPPAFLDVLGLLSQRIDVALYVQRPSAEWFGEAKRARKGEERPEGPVLLANLGTQCRELFDLLVDRVDSGLGEVELESHDPGTDSLLHTLQSDILGMRVRGPHAGADAPPLQLRADDRSLTVHSAHGMLREMEILRDQLLARFEQDKDLSPSDVLVLLPDVDAYAPYVHAAFAPVQRLFRTVTADRSPGDALPLAATFLSLFELAGSRYLAADVLQLLEDEALGRKFGIARSQVPTLRTLVDRARVRWGLDAGQKSRDLDLPAEDANSWAFGLRRLALGVATGPVNGLVLDCAPSADATLSRSELLGSFLALFEAVRESTAHLSEERALPDWADAIESALERLFEAQTSTEKAALQSLREACQQLRRLHAIATQDEPLVMTAAALRQWLKGQLDGKREGSGFLSGSLTFASMRPMRSVPMRILAICGLHDGSFPRSAPRHEFDLMAKDRKVGDRSKRDDDRQLFLDALLSAKDAVLLTHIGRSSKDNAETAPSTVLSELLDHVDDAFLPPKGFARARDAILVDHPLQSFSERYGDGKDERLFTYAAEAPAPRVPRQAAAAAEAAQSEQKPVITIDALVAFWKEPHTRYCEDVLQASFPKPVEDDEDSEPFELDHLDNYGIQDEAVAEALASGEPARLPPETMATGAMPPGPLGQLAQRDSQRQIETFAERIRPLHGTGTARVQIDLGSATVTGEIAGLSPQQLLLWRPSGIKPKDLMRGYVMHCVVAVAREDGAKLPVRTLVAGVDGTHEFAPLAEPREKLQALVDGYLAARTAPPPTPTHAGLEYAKRMQPKPKDPNPDVADALEHASEKYHPNENGRSKSHDLPDPCMTACFSDEDPTGRPEFVEVADRVHFFVYESAQKLIPWP